MHCPPISDESRRELHELRDRSHLRGDECLAILLTGLDLYVSMGKEIELLEMMRDYADQIRGAIEGTPSAKELEELYHWNPEMDDQD